MARASTPSAKRISVIDLGIRVGHKTTDQYHWRYEKCSSPASVDLSCFDSCCRCPDKADSLRLKAKASASRGRGDTIDMM